MKRTPIDALPPGVPDDLLGLLPHGEIYDSSSSPEARVYLIDGGPGFYLKCSARGTLAREAEMTEYFHRLGLGAELLGYVSGERDWLLTSRICGEDATHGDYLGEPRRLAAFLGTELRRLHEIPPDGCPVTDRTAAYLALADENYISGNYDKSHFPDSFGYRSAEEAYAVLSEGRGLLRSDTLLHGDFCLPNIMLDAWQLSGYIDLGCGGVGDRHVDLFWGAWTLGFNLGTDRYRDVFFDAYGRDAFDADILSVVAAAEVFG